MVRSREKIALFVFIGLILAGLASLLVYIFVIGHSLNTTVSKIDDATGNLDGYTAILYKGTAEEKHESVVDRSNSNPSDFNKRDITQILSKRTNNQSNNSDDEVTAAEVAESNTSDSSSNKSKLTMLSLSRSYLSKNACVIELDTENSQKYLQPTVIRANGKTYGVFNIDAICATKNYFEKRIAQYEALKCDFIICITTDLKHMESYKGADIVISAQDEGLSSNGASAEGTFFEDAAFKGQIGTLLISPSRTITAKDVISL